MSAINKVGIWTASLAALAVFAGGEPSLRPKRR